MTVSNGGANITADEIPLRKKVAFLKNKGNYPHSTDKVEAIKTHMSWVFLTDKFAYKLKIPFRYDHMRLLTVEARHQNCKDEVRLNKRLADKVYLDVVPLSLDDKGNIRLGKGEQVIDWLVKMKRLPESKMLDYQVKKNQSLAQNKLQPAADLLTTFYLEAKAEQLSAKDYIQKLQTALREYHKSLKAPEFDLSSSKVETIAQKQFTFLKEQKDVFMQRVNKGKIIEGHGDLKPDHVCLSPVAIIDCLEFDRDLRVLDILDDLAFLALECDRLGASDVGEFFINYYQRKANDVAEEGLINFYKSYKAVIRAMLSIRHLREEQYKDDPKWRRKTLQYLRLADKYLTRNDL